MASDVMIRRLGQQDYETCWHAMQQFTRERDENTMDELWLLEHPPVFTQGQNGKAEHIINPGAIPVIQVDRGGQVTYHGPGQWVVYALVDLRRKKMTTRGIVTALEQSIINLLADYHIKAEAKPDAPGVYIQHKKICSIGLRIRKGCSYHGLAFNVSTDLEPFSRINPCGFKALPITRLADRVDPIVADTLETALLAYLMTNLGYTNPHYQSGFHG
ncbi:MAG TPA: lipoyl(octanoyl) transferase LipB [Gammaproteobacteria bacterium]|nr:lipoyl(octanoyl) transferase LipB [Gammaproteobacteria bacterium]